MHAAAEDIEIGELVDPFQIANAAVDDEPGPGAGRDGGPQVVADEGAILDLAEEIDDQHVAREQGVDHPGVLAAAAAFGGAHALDDALQVGSQRHHAHGDRPADEDAVGVKIDPVAFELEVVVVPAFDHAPGFVVGDEAHPLQDVVGHARPAIGGSLVLCRAE